ncbi:MAG: hypothetical protein PVJ92_03415 [Candidatus Dependentiae bacterium]|jgi:hypothetical protein
MKHTSLFRSLFNFRKKEIDAAFANAQPFASCYGIKVLKADGLRASRSDSHVNRSDGDKGRDDTYAKFIIIPTRGWANAPKRNRLRRQIKAIIFEEKLYREERSPALSRGLNTGSRVSARDDNTPLPHSYILLLYPVAKDLDQKTVRKFLCEAFHN